MIPYQTEVVAVLEALQTSDRGLTADEVNLRQINHGPNWLLTARPPDRLMIFGQQFLSPLIYLLIIAAGIVYTMGETVDAIIIAAVLILNAVIGTIQEGRAQNTLLALSKLVRTDALVFRDGKEEVIPGETVVPGDILLLRAGDKVSADARVLTATNLELDESALTGESLPASKSSRTLARKNLSPADQINMVFRGTYVVRGSGRAVVTATGQRTVIGQISSRLSTLNADVPLKRNIALLSRWVVVAVLALCLLLVLIGLGAGYRLPEIFSIVVAIIVSVIPEGLPVVVTLILATGVSRMAKRQVLVKRLQAVEALGQAKVIAVDKTGTLTKNQMMVTQLFANNQLFTVEGSGYDPVGAIRLNQEVIEPLNHQELLLAGKISALTATATVAYSESSKAWLRLAGDPTEAALLVFAMKLGFNQSSLLTEEPLVTELPFDNDTKYHVALHATGPQHTRLSVVGAPEVLIRASATEWLAGGVQHLTPARREEWRRQLARFTADGLRVLVLAMKAEGPAVLKLGQLPPLTLLGLVGMHDALRPEAQPAVAAAKAAGIRVVMITGDHEDTARSIAATAGIYTVGDSVLSGDELERLSPSALAAKLHQVSVFARVTPEHKLKIIEAFRHRGEIVAMTGDGVNDALSLAAADLGVAMGKIGTAVAQEAADLVLLDDNFGSIVSAVEEGRSIYLTIKQVLVYLFSTGLGEVLTIMAAILLGYPLPVSASQIIWLNLITDGFLVIALALEPKEDGLLKLSTKRFSRGLVDIEMAFRTGLLAGVMVIGTLLIFSFYQERAPLLASTMALTALAVFQWFNAWNCRSECGSIFRAGWWRSRWVIAATLGVVLLQLWAL